MMLTLQIAAGIVLAYAVIVNRNALLRFTSALLALGTIVLVAVLAWWAASSAYTSISPRLSRFVEKLGVMTGSLMMLACMAAGGVGLLWAVHEVFRRPSLYLSKVTWGIATAVNCAMVIAAGYLAAYTPVGAWIDAADRWSRANGHADAASVTIFGVSCLWPFVVVLILRGVRGRLVVTEWLGLDAEDTKEPR